MINIKIILLISLAAYVTCGGIFTKDRNNSSTTEEAGNSSTTVESPEPGNSSTPVESPEPGNSSPTVEPGQSSTIVEIDSETISSEEDTEEYHPTCRRHGIGSCRKAGSDAVTYNIPPLDSDTSGYDRYQCGDVFLYAELDVLKFNGKIVPDVTPKTRPLVIKWDQRKLEVNGKHIKKFNGIKGEGTINFLPENERDRNNSSTTEEAGNSSTSVESPEPGNSSPTVEPGQSSTIVEIDSETIPSEEDTGENNPKCRKHSIGASVVGGSRAVTYNIPPLNSDSNGYDLYYCGNVVLYARLDVLKFNGIIVPDVTPKTRPLVIKWNQGKLKVNGKHIETFNGITGEGTMNFLSKNQR